MLKRIELENYRTFVNKTVIDFGATNYKFLESENVGSNRILKGCLFVGENASGKTNILKAMTLLLELLFVNNDFNFLSNKSFYTDRVNYKINYEFCIDEKNILYCLEFGNEKIVSEKLFVDSNLIIDRIGNTAKLYLNGEKYFDDVADKILFLRRLYFDTNFYNDLLLNNWFSFLRNTIYINCYTRNIISFTNHSQSIYDYLDENDTKEINNFFEKINYNQKISYELETLAAFFHVKSDNDKKFISFNKNETDVFVPEQLESTGNRTLIQILPSFLYATKHNCMIILDEFSSGFHNELEECLLKYFFHYAHDSQIFFATHSTNVLNNTILRPDQIYSVSFKGKAGSVLKRFSEEMPRESQNTEKMYLNGVFDGMPRYNKIFKD